MVEDKSEDESEDKSEDGDAADGPLPILLQQSICSRCIERKIVRSGKGSVFLLCQAGISDPRWPKYPPQPVQRCPKFCAE